MEFYVCSKKRVNINYNSSRTVVRKLVIHSYETYTHTHIYCVVFVPLASLFFNTICGVFDWERIIFAGNPTKEQVIKVSLNYVLFLFIKNMTVEIVGKTKRRRGRICEEGEINKKNSHTHLKLLYY